MVTTKDSDVESEKATLQKKLETPSTMHAETKAGLAKALREMRDNLEKKTRECDVLRAMARILEKRLATLRDAPKTNAEKILRLEFRLASDVKSIAHVATPLKDHRWSNFLLAAEIGELRGEVIDMEGKAYKAV